MSLHVVKHRSTLLIVTYRWVTKCSRIGYIPKELDSRELKFFLTGMVLRLFQYMYRKPSRSIIDKGIKTNFQQLMIVGCYQGKDCKNDYQLDKNIRIGPSLEGKWDHWIVSIPLINAFGIVKIQAYYGQWLYVIVMFHASKSWDCFRFVPCLIVTVPHRYVLVGIHEERLTDRTMPEPTRPTDRATPRPPTTHNVPVPVVYAPSLFTNESEVFLLLKLLPATRSMDWY